MHDFSITYCLVTYYWTYWTQSHKRSQRSNVNGPCCSHLELNRKLRGVKSVDREASTDKDFFAVNQFLGNHSCPAQHSKTSILEFLCVQCEEFLRVRWSKTKGVETNITREVVFLEDTPRAENITRGEPTSEGTVEFKRTNHNCEKFKECGVNGADFVEMTNGGSDILVISLEERVELNRFFSDKHTKSTQHGNTSVLEFGLTVLLHCLVISSSGEAQRVEVCDWADAAGKTVGESSGVRSECGGLGRAEGGCRSNKE
mmetsp:Transcript_15202/g.19845  ORF Transcript_15202/g.19845 Transcript_15202/m.19845 type:complete len:258 (+) Transcript_15202:15-788(+)